MRTPRTAENDALVSDAMRELAQDSIGESSLPDPSFIWWKAQLLRRFEAEREAAAPIEIGDRVNVGAAILGAVALAAGTWNQLPAIALSRMGWIGIGLGAAILLMVAALAALEALRER